MRNGFLYFTSVMIWGSTWLAIKFQLGTVAPEISIAYRVTLAAIILLIYSYVRKLTLRFSAEEHGYMALQGLFIFSLNYLLVYLAEGTLSGGLVAITFSTVIFWNVVFGAVFLNNPIRSGVVIGGLTGVFGLIVIFWPEISTFELSGDRMTGLLLAFGGVLAVSLGNIVSARNQTHKIPVIQSNGYGMAYGGLFMFAFALLRGAEFTFDPSPEYIASLLYLALFGSVIAFGAYLTLLGRIGPDRAAYVTVLFPIVALILSTLFEGLTWGPTGLVGVLIVVVGNLIALSRFRTQKIVPQPAK